MPREALRQPQINIKETLPTKGKISQICLVAATRYSRSGKVYLGLTSEDLPVCTTSPDDLTSNTLRSIEIYEDGSKKIPNLNLSGLPTPVKVNYVGAIMDFEDTGDSISEDIVNISITDEKGSRRPLKIGELALLKAISSSSNPWQMIPEISASDSKVSTKLMYTIFVEKDDLGTDRDIALILKSSLPNDTNEIAFRSFVKDVLNKLLKNDDDQPEGRKRGYREILDNKSQPESEGGILGWFISADPKGPSVENQLYAKGARILRAVGLAEISDETLQALEEPTQVDTGDLDELSTEKLLKVATAFYEKAYHALRYQR